MRWLCSTESDTSSDSDDDDVEVDEECEFVVSKQPVYNCTVCEKPYMSKQAVRVHFDTKHGKAVYECSFCEKTFPTVNLRDKHARKGLCKDISAAETVLSKLENMDTASPADLVTDRVQLDFIDKYLEFSLPRCITLPRRYSFLAKHRRTHRRTSERRWSSLLQNGHLYIIFTGMIARLDG